MMTEAERDEAVERLIQANAQKKQALRPSATWPEITIDDAYAISSEVARRRIAAGGELIGHKIGLTSTAMRRSSNIDEPDYGYLFADMLIENGAKVARANYCVPRVECELTFVLSKPLKGPGVSVLDVMRATEYVVPSMEIIDARLDEPRKIFDTISDNGAAAGIVLGGRPVRPFDIDLGRVGGVLYRNTDIEETGLACGVLGNPALGIAWLANKLAPFNTVLEPGHLMLSGSFVRPVWAEPGDTIRADFGELGNVSIEFV